MPCNIDDDEYYNDDWDDPNWNRELPDLLDDDRDLDNPSKYSEDYDWYEHDFESDPDWY